MGSLEKIMNRIANISILISAVLIILIFLLINTEIVCRYFLGTSTLIADEYCGYFFAIAMYIGLCASIYNNKLIKIDLPGKWSDMTSKKIPRFIVGISAVMLNVILLIAIYHTFWTSWLFKSRSIQASMTLLAIPQSGVVVGVALMVLASVAILLRTFKGKGGSQ